MVLNFLILCFEIELILLKQLNNLNIPFVGSIMSHIVFLLIFLAKPFVNPFLLGIFILQEVFLEGDELMEHK